MLMAVVFYSPSTGILVRDIFDALLRFKPSRAVSLVDFLTGTLRGETVIPSSAGLDAPLSIGSDDNDDEGAEENLCESQVALLITTSEEVEIPACSEAEGDLSQEERFRMETDGARASLAVSSEAEGDIPQEKRFCMETDVVTS